jgi:tRNA-intron endonuclease
VKISKEEAERELFERGYGTPAGKTFLLGFHEALYLQDKGILRVESSKHKEVSFRELLKEYESVDENAWAKYLVYRDLRNRGYVVREGFGKGIDFRLYERGEYSKDTAKYLVLSVQEGKPMLLGDLVSALKQCQSLKKELVLAAMNRRGEIVYYFVSQFNVN